MGNEESSCWSGICPCCCPGKKPPKTAGDASSPDKIPAGQNAKVDPSRKKVPDTTGAAASSPDNIPARQDAKVDLSGKKAPETRVAAASAGKVPAENAKAKADVPEKKVAAEIRVPASSSDKTSLAEKAKDDLSRKKAAETAAAGSSPDKIHAEENAKVDLDGLLRHITKLFQMKEGKIAAYEPVAGQQFWPSSESFNNLKTFLYDGIKANKYNTLVDSKAIASIMLQGMGSGSMVAAGFLVVANILERFEDVRTNQIECLDLLKEMLKLGKLVKEFKELKGDMHNEIEAATALIVEGSIMCCAHINSPKFSQFFRTGINRENIDQIKKELDTVYRDLHTKMLINLHRKFDDQPGHPGDLRKPEPEPARLPVTIHHADNVNFFLNAEEDKRKAKEADERKERETEEKNREIEEEETKRVEKKKKAGEDKKIIEEQETNRVEEKKKVEENKRKIEDETKRREEKKKTEEDKKIEEETKRVEEKNKAEEDKRNHSKMAVNQ